MNIPETETISTEQDRQEVINRVKEAAGSLLQIDSMREHVRDIANGVKEEFGIKPAEFNRIVKIYHKQSLNEEQEKHDKITGLYEKLFTEKTPGQS